MREPLLEEFADDGNDSPTVGRYVLHRQIARGGMATIHIARLMGDEGFSRIVAAKRLLPEFAEDSEFVAMFLDEARIASKCHHKNVVPVLDVVTTQDEVLLVQEFVHGAPLHYLIAKAHAAKERIPVPIAVSIACQVLAGLQATHDMVDEMGTPLNVVHRDVSPQNVMIATDGTARLLDFGVAKATMAAHVTREGTYKGKLAYSAPEQLHGKASRQSDLYSLAMLIWELLVGHRMHGSQSEAELVTTIMTGALPTITETLGAEHEWDTIDDVTWRQLSALEPIVRKGLYVDTQSRWKTAVEMEDALLAAVTPAKNSEVAAWLKKHGHEYLDKHDKAIAIEEASWRRKFPVTVTGARRTPLPSELRRGTLADGTSARGAMPPTKRGPYLLIAILAMLVGALAIGVFVLLRDDAKTAAASAPPPAEPPPVITPAHDKTVEKAKPVEPDVPPAVETVPATAKPVVTDDTPDLDVQLETVAKTATTVRAKKAAVRVPTKARATTKPDATPGSAQKPGDCTPPYYYEGTKKVFKPQCL